MTDVGSKMIGVGECKLFCVNTQIESYILTLHLSAKLIKNW